MKVCEFSGCGKEVTAHRKKSCSDEHGQFLRKQRDRERYVRLRDRVLAHYGSRCVCCGETTKEFLALDHKNGNGQKHRKELGGGAIKMYRWVVKNGFPDIFQVLCHNCNMAFGCCGYCPHQTEQRAS